MSTSLLSRSLFSKSRKMNLAGESIYCLPPKNKTYLDHTSEMQTDPSDDQASSSDQVESKKEMTDLPYLEVTLHASTDGAPQERTWYLSPLQVRQSHLWTDLLEDLGGDTLSIPKIHSPAALDCLARWFELSLPYAAQLDGRQPDLPVFRQYFSPFFDQVTADEVLYAQFTHLLQILEMEKVQDLLALYLIKDFQNLDLESYIFRFQRSAQPLPEKLEDRKLEEFLYGTE